MTSQGSGYIRVCYVCVYKCVMVLIMVMDMDMDAKIHSVKLETQLKISRAQKCELA